MGGEANGQSWTGALLLLLGLWLILRTVRADSSGKTLVNRILAT